MNTPQNDNSWQGKWHKSFIPKWLMWLVGVTTVSNAVPNPIPEPSLRAQWIEENQAEKSPFFGISPIESTFRDTQEHVSTVLNKTSENPEKKIIEILVQARKDRIMLEKTQDQFFELCHAHYLWEKLIISGNPKANIQPIKKYLHRIGTNVAELEKLCWVRV